MYKIYINDELVSEVILPCYVFYDTIVQSWGTCSYDKAEAVLVNPTQTGEEPIESYYADLVEKSYRHEGFPVATIEKDS